MRYLLPIVALLLSACSAQGHHPARLAGAVGTRPDAGSTPLSYIGLVAIGVVCAWLMIRDGKPDTPDVPPPSIRDFKKTAPPVEG